ncbi:MAG: extracellular solute-binding protein [Clostridiales bacterium]|nr:extracellular solute-binding protein [Clostridiales bacterium]
MKRAVCLILSVLMLVPFLSACHGSKGLKAFEMPDGLDENKEYRITFWAKNDTNKTQVNIYKNAIADFEALYPNIHVELRLYTDYGKIYNDVITNISTGTTPNVCITYPDHIATYMTGENVMVPLDGLMDDPRFGLGGSEVRFDSPKRDEVIARYLDEGVIGGKHWALPFMRSTEALYVNRDYVEKLGYTLPEVVTWDFIWEVSEAALRKNDDGTYFLNGGSVMIPFIYKSSDNMMIQYLRQAGADYSDENGNIGIFSDATKDFLFTVAEHAGSRAFSTFKISSYPGNFLNAGQCVFGIDSTAGATWMGSKAGHQDISSDKLVDFEMAVLPIPQVDPDNPVMISQGPSVAIFNKKDPGEVLASWLFAQFLLTNKVQIAYAETEGYVPVTEKARKDPGYEDYLARAGEDSELHYSVKLAATKLLLDNVDNTFITPVFNGSASLRDAAGELIEATSKSARRNETVDEAYMEKLFKSVNALYRLDQRGESAAERSELGKLPATAVVLLSALGAAWLGIGAYGIMHIAKKKKR